MINKLYTDYYNQILWYCMNLTNHNIQLAEDITQDTFIKALENMHILNDLSESKCRSWLYTTSRNIFIDKIRRISNEPKISPKLYNEDDLSKIVVIQLCQQLPEEEKDIFYMRYIEGYNSTELGEIFNMSASTVRSRLSSARKKIANIYYDEGKKGD